MSSLIEAKPSHNREIKAIVMFYVVAYVLNYVASFFLLKSNLGIHSNRIYALLVYTAALLVLMFALTWFSSNFLQKSIESLIGTEGKVIDSFLWANAFSLPIPVLWIVSIQLMSIDIVLSAAKPSWVEAPISSGTILLAILFWTLIGILSFAFYQAVPYEILSPLLGKLAVPIIAIFWSGLYNSPFITGKLDPVDVLFFGLLFSYAYHKSRNIIGVILAYLLNENPMWWMISAVFGNSIENAFKLFLVVRAIIALFCVVMLLCKIKERS